ncbi:cysteine desulfurase NifS [Acidobacteriia bacterium AH_259_A11_L15]|nr:cysteine desulfurase NifS [Acidobacteriia bacterium AH_259_A11_L15]
MRRVYLDYNATTPLAPEVVQAMLPFLTEEYGNASSIHSVGQRARAAVEQARAQVAALIGAREKEIVFTSGGTEADNLAVRGVVEAAERPRKPESGKHVVTSTIEHHAVLNTCQALEAEGVAVTYVPVNSAGLIDPEEVRRALTPDTVLISIMHANNELGTVQAIAEIARIARGRKIPFHTDAVQAVGKLPVNVREWGVDLLSLSAHKICGPKGVGALWVRRGMRLKPLFFGGHHERDRRPGTENVPGIVGLGAAAELAGARRAEEAVRVKSLRDELESRILARVPHATVNGDRQQRTPNTSNISFEFVEGEALVIALDLKGIACSTGAACSAGAVEPSHVLTAIGLSPEGAHGSLRFSLGRQTTREDIDYVAETLPAVVEHLRELSPLYKKSVAAASK